MRPPSGGIRRRRGTTTAGGSGSSSGSAATTTAATSGSVGTRAAMAVSGPCRAVAAGIDSRLALVGFFIKVILVCYDSELGKVSLHSAHHLGLRRMNFNIINTANFGIKCAKIITIQ